jgi:hypothetical protein
VLLVTASMVRMLNVNVDHDQSLYLLYVHWQAGHSMVPAFSQACTTL